MARMGILNAITLVHIQAKFFCRTCDYHLDTAQLCFRHIYEDRHIRVKLTKEQDFLIRYVPTPSAAHVEVLTKTLEDVVSKVRINEDEIQRRRTTVENLEKLVVDKGLCAAYGVGINHLQSEHKHL